MTTAQRSAIGGWPLRTALATSVLALLLVAAGSIGLPGERRPGGLIATSLLLVVSVALVLVAQRAGRLQQTHIGEVERVSRLYSVLRLVNQAIVRAPTRDELFSKVCHALVTQGGFRMAWVAWHDTTRNELVPAAQAGDADGLLASIRIRLDDEKERRDPSA